MRTPAKRRCCPLWPGATRRQCGIAVPFVSTPSTFHDAYVTAALSTLHTPTQANLLPLARIQTVRTCPVLLEADLDSEFPHFRSELCREPWASAPSRCRDPAARLAIHGPLLLMQLPNSSYDGNFHMFFAAHYAKHWFNPWNEKWFTGFSQTTYPPLQHQWIALFSHVMSLNMAYMLVQLIAIVLLPVGMYRFAKLWVDERTASFAALGSVLLGSLSFLVYQSGQLSTTMAAPLYLNALPYLYEWMTRARVSGLDQGSGALPGGRGGAPRDPDLRRGAVRTACSVAGTAQPPRARRGSLGGGIVSGLPSSRLGRGGHCSCCCRTSSPCCTTRLSSCPSRTPAAPTCC